MSAEVKTKIMRLAAEGDYRAAIDELREARADAYLARDVDELRQLLEVAEQLVVIAKNNLDRMRARDAAAIISGNLSALTRVPAANPRPESGKSAKTPPTGRQAAPGCALLLVLLVLAVFGVSRLVGGGGGGEKPSNSSTSSDIVINADASFCEEYSPISKIKVVVSATNLGARDGTIDVTPIRNYTDGTSNRSALDTIYVDVPAGATKVGFATFDYKASEHGLVSCVLEYDHDGQLDSVSVKVNNY